MTPSCSGSCQVEPGYSCTQPVPADLSNIIADPGFEAGPFGGIWTEASVAFDSLICNADICGRSAQRSGDYWVWFGGVIIDPEEALVSQIVTVPDTATELTFWLQAAFCDSAVDYIEVLVDSTQVWLLTGDDPSCGEGTYSQEVVDISAWADNAEHEISFHAETFSASPEQDWSNFYLDDLDLIHGSAGAGAEPVRANCGLAGPGQGRGPVNLFNSR